VTRALALVPFVLAIALAGCDLSELGDRETGPTQRTTLDERGSYGGVGVGSSEADVRAALGEPGGGDGYNPLSESDYRGPPHIRVLGGVKPILLRYDETAYLLNTRTKRVFSMIVSKPGATTSRGVGVGDPLSGVRRNYENAVCGRAVAGEPLFGDEVPTYPWCRIRRGDVEVFFGDDPIQSITVTRK
jgi:hypothetical protein